MIKEGTILNYIFNFRGLLENILNAKGEIRLGDFAHTNNLAGVRNRFEIYTGRFGVGKFENNRNILLYQKPISVRLKILLKI
ncbi:hypothetical protein DLK05_14070 [Ancylomarina longa]|uniref:Uncharacterized protein n=1 Tax=Ancylomarina longa TaxID=2487017 RepID=A0A434AG55_9BACT|nr:hypothetical protein DLK05_14070 [Ancylomarina longa]